jgi:hypothetical protein
MMFNHADEKKGLQHTHRWYFQQFSTKAQRAFAKTCGNRYASHGVASTELICRRDTYIEFMKNYVRLSKAKAALNNMEANFVKGLECLYTVTELCAFALYSQVLELPVMKLVRRRYGDDGKVQNHLTMGWLRDRIAAFAGLVVADPEVLLRRDAGTPDGLPSTLDHAPWSEPELFDAIDTLRPELPHLLDIISRMFDSALGKWVTFCSEFDAGSTIDRLTQEQIDRIWMPNTNDGNESNNGAIRIAYRNNPNMSELVLNARNMVKANGTTDFMRHVLSAVDSRFLREEARRLLGASLEKLRRDSVVEAKQEAAQKRKAKELKRAARLAEQRRKEQEMWKHFELEVAEDDPAVLKTKRTAKLTCKQWLKLQLLFHRRRALAQQEVFPTKTALKNNPLRAEQLSRCIRAYKAATADGLVDETAPQSPELEDEEEDTLEGLGDAESDDEYGDEDAEDVEDEELDEELDCE